ncbi:hypothetical protein ABW21_db0204913 [Orbilia brochopaga]|nr:hypothetical protein ABW21_db0204913 [Drechslerella brochopaga]
MQSHGVKRTPEEFKEIRREWKQRKKEEEQAKKAEEERERQQRQMDGLSSLEGNAQTASGQYNNVPQQRQLPPPGYSQPPMQPGMHHYAQATSGLDPLQRFNPPTASMYAGYPHGAYGHPPNHHIYQSRQPPGAEEPDADADADPDVPNASYTHT